MLASLGTEHDIHVWAQYICGCLAGQVGLEEPLVLFPRNLGMQLGTVFSATA